MAAGGRLLGLLVVGASAACLTSPARPSGDGDPSGGGPPDGSPTGGGCAAEPGETASALTDDFGDQETSPCWRTVAEDPACSLAENAAGTLVVGAPPDGVGRCGYETAARYDLTDSAVLVEVLTTPQLLESYASLEVRRDAQNLVVIRQVQLDMHCYKIVDSVRSDGCLMSHDPTTHRWWRIREAAGTLTWERSADGVSWYQFGSTVTPFDVSSVAISFGVTSTEAPGATAEARFDRYNLPP